MGALPLILKKKNIGNHKVLRYLMFLSLIVIIQIIYGAFVAGLKGWAGPFPTWPKMGSEFILEKYFLLTQIGIF